MRICVTVEHLFVLAVLFSVFGKKAVRERVANRVDLANCLYHIAWERFDGVDYVHLLEKIHFVEHVVYESAEFFGSPKLREISAVEKISGDKVGENFIQKGIAYRYLASHHLVDCNLKTKGSIWWTWSAGYHASGDRSRPHGHALDRAIGKLVRLG